MRADTLENATVGHPIRNCTHAINIAAIQRGAPRAAQSRASTSGAAFGDSIDLRAETDRRVCRPRSSSGSLQAKSQAGGNGDEGEAVQLGIFVHRRCPAFRPIGFRHKANLFVSKLDRFAPWCRCALQCSDVRSIMISFTSVVVVLEAFRRKPVGQNRPSSCRTRWGVVMGVFMSSVL